MAQSRTSTVADAETDGSLDKVGVGLEPFKLEYFSKSGRTVELNED